MRHVVFSSVNTPVNTSVNTLGIRMQKEKRISRTYKLSEETLGQITDLAKDRQITYTDVIEMAVRGLYQRKYAVNTCVNTEEAPSNTSDNTVLGLLNRQLDVKDRQIEALNEALLAAQETAKAAQALHGAEKVEHAAIESTEQKEERLSRWERLKRAWRG